MDEMPDGFGSYHNTVEIDSIVAKMEAGSNIIASLKGAMGSSIQNKEEFRRIQEREDNQDLAAYSVIRKFNTNSERILNLLSTQQGNKKAEPGSKDYLMESMDRKDRQ